MSWLDNIHIRSRIVFSYSILLVLFIGFSVLTIFEMQRLFDLTTVLYNHPFRVSNASQRASTGVIKMHRTMKDVSSAETQHQLQLAINEVQIQERNVYEDLEIVQKYILGEEGKALIQNTIDMFANWKPIRMEVMELVSADKHKAANEITKNKGADYVEMLERQMKKLNAYAHTKADGFMEESQNVWRDVFYMVFLLVIGMVGIFLVSLLVIIRSLKANLANLTNAMSVIQETGQLKKADITGNNEITELSVHFNQLIERLNLQMWIREGIGSINKELSGVQDYKLILNKGLSIVCEYCEACVGALYSYSSLSEISTLEASFAYVEREYIANQFQNGEGVVGQVALERKPILLKNVEKSQVESISGTNSAAPKQIYSSPLIYEEQLVGVIEIASFDEIDVTKREYLDSVSNILATYIYTAKQNQKVKELFQETQNSNKDLEIKSEELNKKNQQLSSLNDELQIQTHELNIQKSELEKQRMQLAEADRLKSEFLSNMSHELRTPLNSILALSQLMIRHGTGKDAQKENEYLQVIERNGHRLLSLINDILDLSKIEAGRVELEAIEFNAAEVVERVVETVSPLVDQRKVSIDCEYDKSIMLHSDKNKIQQILLNLVSNAIKFTEEGSITLRVDRENEYIVFSVKDTGIGIETDAISTIFDEFRQIDGSISRKHDGTGLGLAISQKLANRLGGEITVESEKGNGSLFKLLIPLKQQPKTSPLDSIEIASSESPLVEDFSGGEWNNLIVGNKGKPVILIVDDDSVTRQNLKNHLSKAGYSVYTASNGKEGHNYAQTLKPSLITLDILMPEMDGFEVLRELKDNEEIKNTPIIVVSVSDDVETGMALGASSFITKPINFSQLMMEIKKLLPNISSPKVLAVDDDPIVRQQLSELLMDRKFLVETANNGREALERLESNQPDLVILDLMMPEINGMNALRQIRKNPKTEDLPVIILTAKDLSPEEHKELAQSVHKVMTKLNSDNNQLLDQIDKTIQSLPTSTFEQDQKPVILVIEDNKIASMQIQSALKEEGFRYLLSRDGNAAMKVLKENTPDAIILDLMMPEMDGFQVLKRLRSHKETSKIPVLVLTAKELTKAEHDQLKFNNIQQLIQKGSVSKEQLVSAINDLFIHPDERLSAKDLEKQEDSVKSALPINKPPEECKILIVEDNPDNLVTVNAILDTLGFGYTTTDNGESALELIVEQQPDLVLLDVQLPGLSGIEVVQRMKAKADIAHIPVISLTAKAMKGDREDLLQQGFDDYISKPIDPDELRAVLKKWTGTKQQ